jgi:hypothetical protein
MAHSFFGTDLTVFSKGPKENIQEARSRCQYSGLLGLWVILPF